MAVYNVGDLGSKSFPTHQIRNARMVKLVDAADLESVAERRGGSSPPLGTKF
jgi:hypothetical protein